MPPKLQHYRTATADKRPDPAAMADGQFAQNQSPATPGAFIKLADGTVSKIGPAYVGTTAPNSAPAGSAGNSVGETWLDTSVTPALLRVWDGAQWVAAVTAAGSKWTDIGGNVLSPTAGGAIATVGNQPLRLGFDQAGGAALFYDSDGNLKLAPRSGYHTVLPNGFLGIGTVPTTALHSDLAGFGVDYSAARFSYSNLYGGDFGGGIEQGVGGYARISVLNGGEPVPQLTIHPAKAQFTVAMLAGVGTEMVVADAGGNLTRQAIGSGPQGPAGPAGADGAAGPPGPTAVSADAGNTSTLGTDGLIYTPVPAAGNFVPQDSATGAAFMPAGGDAARPPAPVGGYTRWNPEREYLEVYTGAVTQWNQLAYVPIPPTLPPDVVYAADTVLATTTVICNNLTVNAGVTVTVAGQCATFICFGDVNINGTITGSEKGAPGGFVTLAAANVFTPSQVGGNIGGSVLGVTGGGVANAYTPQASLVGSGGSTGAGAAGTGGAFLIGGNGGAGILIRSYKNITVPGTIAARGGNGTTTPNGVGFWSCGSGGGSGGSVTLHASGSINFTGIIDVGGGAGCPALSYGVADVPCNGGGGGGGGYVTLEAEVSLVNTGTINLSGGPAGAAVLTPETLGGGNGASFGGRGGTGAGSPAGAIAGSDGTLVLSGSII